MKCGRQRYLLDAIRHRHMLFCLHTVALVDINGGASDETRCIVRQESHHPAEAWSDSVPPAMDAGFCAKDSPYRKIAFDAHQTNAIERRNGKTVNRKRYSPQSSEPCKRRPLAFTAGIGEHNPQIREHICRRLGIFGVFGVMLDGRANVNSLAVISSDQSRISVAEEPTNEEWIAANHMRSLIQIP